MESLVGFFPKYAQYLTFEQREKNLDLGMEILKNITFHHKRLKNGDV